MSSIDISIIIISYNQEKYILNALNSIKYQIVNYGKNLKIQLVVADDGSKDLTQTLTNKWCEQYGSLFSKITLLFNKDNKGTCKNFSEGFKNAEGERFFLMAADDMFSNEDAFSFFLNCSVDDVALCMPYMFDGNKILEDTKYYASNILQYFLKPKEFYRIVDYKCPIINGSYVGTRLLDKEVMQFSEKFDLIEDQTKYVKLFERRSDIVYKFQEIPIMLYRISPTQVTNYNGIYYKRIMQDKERLTKYVLTKKHTAIERYCIKMECFRICHHKAYYRGMFVFDIENYIKMFRYIINWKKICKRKKMLFEESRIKKLNNYLSEIKMESESLLKQFDND